MLIERDEFIRQQAILCQESDHRFLNSLQMTASLLSMQARTCASPEAASHMTLAANRVIMIGQIHRRLHGFDDSKVVAFKPFLEGLCHDFATLLTSEDGSDLTFAIDAIELELPTATSIPLGFIVSELLTNAAKHGEGAIRVKLEQSCQGGYALSVANDGPGLPTDFEPALSKGLGMMIIRSLVAKIGGTLKFGRAENDMGARFTVLFASPSKGQ